MEASLSSCGRDKLSACAVCSRFLEIVGRRFVQGLGRRARQAQWMRKNDFVSFASQNPRLHRIADV